MIAIASYPISYEVTPTGSDTNGGGSLTAGGYIVPPNCFSQLIATNAISASPTISHSTYSFTASDINHYVFLTSNSSGWYGGIYKIVNVTAGSAMLDATIGAGEGGVYFGDSQMTPTILQTQGIHATLPTATGMSWFMIYNRSDSPRYSYTDLVAHTVSGNVVSSSGFPFGTQLVGSVINISSSAGGWTSGPYCITRIITGGLHAVLDRTAAVTGSISGVGNLGGALASPGKACWFADNRNGVWIKGGYTYSITSSATGAANSILQFGYTSGINCVTVIGYYQRHGDIPTPEQQPVMRLEAPLSNITICGAAPGARADCALFFITAEGSGILGSYGFYRHPFIGSNTACTTYGCCAKNCFVGFRSAGVNPEFHNSFAYKCQTGFNGGTHLGCLTIAATTGFTGGTAISCIASHCIGVGFDESAYYCTSNNNGSYGIYGFLSIGSVSVNNALAKNSVSFSPTIQVDCYFGNNTGVMTNLASYNQCYTIGSTTSGTQHYMTKISSALPYTDEDLTPIQSSPLINYGSKFFSYWNYASIDSGRDIGAVESRDRKVRISGTGGFNG